MWICKLLGHKLIQPREYIFCERCGLDKNMVQEMAYIKDNPIVKGKTQFIEPVTFAEKFKDAKNINDMLEHYES